MFSPPTPTAPPPPPNPPVFGQDKMKSKPQTKSMQPTFLGAQDQPTRSNLGMKTLLGQ
jgi:hypothetical protein